MESTTVLDFSNNLDVKTGFHLEQTGLPHATHEKQASVVFVEIEIDSLEEAQVLGNEDQEEQPQQAAKDVQDAPAMAGWGAAPINLGEWLPDLGADRSSEQTPDHVSHAWSPHRNVRYHLPASGRTREAGTGVRVYGPPKLPAVSDEVAACPRVFRARY